MEKNKIKIYFFVAPNCPSCQKEKMFFDSMKEKMRDKIDLEIVDVSKDDNAVLVSRFLVTSVPTTIIQDGQIINSYIGWSPSLQKILTNIINGS